MGWQPDDLEAAMSAVRAACKVCEAVRRELVSEDTLLKKDRSPVTVADYSAQAVVTRHIASYDPDFQLVAEEEATELNPFDPANPVSRVHRFVSLDQPDVTMDQVVEAIGKGGHLGGHIGRFWTLDPIDGTKGFLRNDQYAVALALIENGRVILGVLGCPNLPWDVGESVHNDGPRGCLFFAARGFGARAASLHKPDQCADILADRIEDVSLSRFCASVETGHSARGDEEAVAKRLGLTRPPLRMDSQCKYGAVARGDAQIYLRMPTSADYQEKIWDHAAGVCILEEAGGRVSDIYGKPLDFSAGRTLARNHGVIASAAGIHDEVTRAVRAVL